MVVPKNSLLASWFWLPDGPYMLYTVSFPVSNLMICPASMVVVAPSLYRMAIPGLLLGPGLTEALYPFPLTSIVNSSVSWITSWRHIIDGFSEAIVSIRPPRYLEWFTLRDIILFPAIADAFTPGLSLQS